MAGKKSIPPAKAAVADVMMDDLGNNRVEELLHVNDRQPRIKLGPNPFLNRGQQDQSRRGVTHPNSPAQKWKAAVFDDDDAAAVSGLDSLDDGNAHRLSSGESRSRKNHLPEMDRDAKRAKYDPSQPIYRRRTPKKGQKKGQPADRMGRSHASDGSLHVSPLGGVVPDGGVVTRWDSGRPANAINYIDNPFRPAGRGRPVSAQNDSPIGQPPQAAIPDRGRGGHIPNPLQVDGGSRGAPTQEIPKGVGRGHSPVVRTQPAQARDRSPTSSDSKTATIVCPPVLEVPRPPSHDASWVPPHLRGTSRSRPSATSVQLRPTLPTMPPQEVFLQEDVLVLSQSITKKSTKGQIIVYVPLYLPVCIWELIREDERAVTRGDLRGLLPMLSDGSRVFLRRRKDGRVLSDPLRFPTVDGANAFVAELEVRAKQFASSDETLYTEITVNWPSAGVARGTTDKPAENATNESDVKSVGKSARRAPGSSLGLSQSSQSEIVVGKRELATSTAEPSQHKDEPRPKTPTISLPAAELRPTVRVGSGAADGNLISFSPEGNLGTLPSDELAGLINNWPPLAGGSCTIVCPEDQKKNIQHAAEQEAAQNLKIIDHMLAPEGIPGDHHQVNNTALKRIFDLLSGAFGQNQPLCSDLAYMNSLLRLVVRDEFMGLSPDEQKTSLEALRTNVNGKGSRTILLPEEILALRSGDEVCPEAIKSFDPSLREGSSLLKPSDEASKGLWNSCWAELEAAKQHSTTRGKNALVHSLATTSDVDCIVNKRELIVDRKGSSHRRSSTKDTMSILADRMGSLRVSSDW